MWNDFKQFIMRGNVMDLAVGVILGASFGAIVTSMVNDVIMPPIGLILGHIDFKDLFVALNGVHYDTLADAKKASAPVIAYGNFINTVISFIIIAFVVFILVQQVNRLYKRHAATPEAPPPGPTPEVKLLTEIRDALTAR